MKLRLVLVFAEHQMFKQVPSSWATSHCPRRSTPSRGSKRCRSTPFIENNRKPILLTVSSCQSPVASARQLSSVPRTVSDFLGDGRGRVFNYFNFKLICNLNWKQSCLETYMSSASLSSALSGCLTCHFGLEHHFNPFAPAGLTPYLLAQP